MTTAMPAMPAAATMLRGRAQGLDDPAARLQQQQEEEEGEEVLRLLASIEAALAAAAATFPRRLSLGARW